MWLSTSRCSLIWTLWTNRILKRMDGKSFSLSLSLSLSLSVCVCVCVSISLSFFVFCFLSLLSSFSPSLLTQVNVLCLRSWRGHCDFSLVFESVWPAEPWGAFTPTHARTYTGIYGNLTLFSPSLHSCSCSPPSFSSPSLSSHSMRLQQMTSTNTAQQANASWTTKYECVWERGGGGERGRGREYCMS